jgi:hypothetical protein
VYLTFFLHHYCSLDAAAASGMGMRSIEEEKKKAGNGVRWVVGI